MHFQNLATPYPSFVPSWVIMTALTNRIQQEECCMTSEARSWKAVSLPEGSPLEASLPVCKKAKATQKKLSCSNQQPQLRSQLKASINHLTWDWMAFRWSHRPGFWAIPADIKYSRVNLLLWSPVQMSDLWATEMLLCFRPPSFRIICYAATVTGMVDWLLFLLLLCMYAHVDTCALVEKKLTHLSRVQFQSYP